MFTMSINRANTLSNAIHFCWWCAMHKLRRRRRRRIGQEGGKRSSAAPFSFAKIARFRMTLSSARRCLLWCTIQEYIFVNGKGELYQINFWPINVHTSVRLSCYELNVEWEPEWISQAKSGLNVEKCKSTIKPLQLQVTQFSVSVLISASLRAVLPIMSTA